MPPAVRIHRALLLLFSCSPVGFLTASSAMALYRARGKPSTAAFVVSAYVNLLLLYGCLGMFERAPPHDLRKRTQLKIAISFLATTLNVSFCHQVTKWMPPTISVLLWFLAFVVAAAGFWLFFVHDDRRRPRPLARAHDHVDDNR